MSSRSCFQATGFSFSMAWSLSSFRSGKAKIKIGRKGHLAEFGRGGQAMQHVIQIVLPSHGIFFLDGVELVFFQIWKSQNKNWEEGSPRGVWPRRSGDAACHPDRASKPRDFLSRWRGACLLSDLEKPK